MALSGWRLYQGHVFFSLVHSDIMMMLIMTWLCKLWRFSQLSCSLNIEKILVFVSWTLMGLRYCWLHFLFSQFFFSVPGFSGLSFLPQITPGPQPFQDPTTSSQLQFKKTKQKAYFASRVFLFVCLFVFHLSIFHFVYTVSPVIELIMATILTCRTCSCEFMIF